MLSAAVSVSVGADPPGGVAAAKRLAQAVPEAMLPLELTQDERMLASVFTSATDKAAPAGRAGPGAVPVDRFAILFAVANAFSTPSTLVAEVPALVGELMNRASDQAPATVVTSFRLMKVVLALASRDEQEPRAAINARAPLLELPGSPGLPPVATM